MYVVILMSNGNRIIKIHVMNDGIWVVDFNENPLNMCGKQYQNISIKGKAKPSEKN